MQLRRDAKGIYGDLSDHYGVDAVIGWEFDRCDPMRALTNPDGAVSGELPYGGAYQWYRFDEPGTYTLQVYSPDFDIEVTLYDADDLSTPLDYFEGTGSFVEDDRQITSVLDVDGPFYLRVRAASPAATGHYQLTLNQNRGSSWSDYLVLEPGEEESGTFAKVLYGDPQDRLYFKFEQKALWTTNLGNQEHRFSVKTCVVGAPCVPATFSLWDESHTKLHSSAASATTLSEVGDNWLPNVDDHFYLTIDRDDENTQREVAVLWETDLKVITLGDLTCHAQEDYYGDDHVYVDIQVDGVSPGPTNLDLWYGQIDTNGSVLYPVAFVAFDIGEIRFKDHVRVKLFEDDDIDADDWLGTDWIHGGGLGAAPYTNSNIPGVNEDPNALVFYEDDAAYSLNWWVKE